LPREIQVLRAELPSGRHQVQLQPISHAGTALAAGQSRSVEIIDGRNQYLIVISPGTRLHVVSSKGLGH
jgi:hypothetical protein